MQLLYARMAYLAPGFGALPTAPGMVEGLIHVCLAFLVMADEGADGFDCEAMRSTSRSN